MLKTDNGCENEMLIEHKKCIEKDSLCENFAIENIQFLVD